jgi:hypothetical protein
MSISDFEQCIVGFAHSTNKNDRPGYSQTEAGTLNREARNGNSFAR